MPTLKPTKPAILRVADRPTLLSRGTNPTDKESIQFWAEGYISGLAAGSRHDILGAFRLQDLGAWLDRYCAANPQTKLPLALNALGREMLAHPGGPL